MTNGAYRPRIAVLAAGGTIGSTKDQSGSLKAEGKGQELLSLVLAKRSDLAAEYDLRIKQVFTMLSEDLHPSDWGEIARAIASEINDSSSQTDGIVIAHGTDTLAFTSSAVTFMLAGVRIPVVFTGALYPFDHSASDGPQNLQDSIMLAANPDYAGMFVVFQGRDEVSRQVTLANQTVSIIGQAKTFGSTDGLTAGRIVDGRISLPTRIRAGLMRRTSQKERIVAQAKVDERVKILRVYPGFDPTDVLTIARSNCRAIILELYHSGTACTRDVADRSLSLLPAIRQCRSDGVLVFGASVPREGDIYRSTDWLIKAGMTPLYRISLEAAYTKLMWLLGQGEPDSAVIEKMNINLCGEISPTR